MLPFRFFLDTSFCIEESLPFQYGLLFQKMQLYFKILHLFQINLRTLFQSFKQMKHADYLLKYSYNQKLEKMQATMVKALTEIVSVDIGQSLVSMSVVEKQNESGLKFNERLFIVVHGSFFGYISKAKMNEAPNKINIEQAKVKVPMKNLYSVEIVDEIITIKFTILESGKLVPKEWVLKTASNKMANFWKQLMEYEIKTMKQLSKKQSNASPQKDRSKNSSLSNKNSPQKKETGTKQAFIPAQQQKKQGSSQLKKTAKVYQNPLFEDSDPEQDQRQRQRQRSSRRRPGAPIRPISQDKNKATESKIKEQSIDSRVKQVKQEIKPEKKLQVSKKITQSTPQNLSNPKPDSEPQIKHQIKSQIKPQIKPEANITATKKQSLIALNLEKIEEQPVQDTPNIKQSRLSKKTPNAYPKSYQKSPQKKKQKIANEQQKISQKFDLGIKESEFINEVLKNLDDQNQKYPIQQLTYKHQDVQKVVKLYGKTLNSASNQKDKTQKLLNYILQTQKQKMNRSISKISVPDGSPWIYKQIVLEQVDNLINFKNKCRQLMKALYIQVHNRKSIRFIRTKQQKNIIFYQIQDLQVKVPLMMFKKSQNNANINVLDKSADNLIKKQFKYLKYLYKIIKNQDKIRAPYSCLCQYGGIIALFKSKFVIGQRLMLNTDKNIINLQEKSGLSLQKVLKNKLKPLKELYYNDLRNGDTSSTFEYCMITDVQNLFPCDLNNSNPSHAKQLRMELIEQEFKEKILPYCTNQDLEYSNNKPQIKLLQELSQSLNRKINDLIKIFNEGFYYFLNPSQLSNFFHSRGVNMRYLKNIYLKANIPFIKSTIASEMVSRCIKKLFRKTLQDECFEQSVRNNTIHMQQDLDNLLKDKCIDLFNLIFGNSPQSDAIWELINKNFQEKYQIRLQMKEEINKGQLLISTAYHCKLILDWSAIEITQMFNTNQFLKKDYLKESILTVKSFEPASSQLKHGIESRLKQISSQNFTFIVNKLKLKKQKIPRQLQLFQNFSSSIKIYLANFVEPQQLDWANNYSHLAIFENAEPSINSFKIDISMIKWYLRTNKKHKYLNKFGQFSNRISKLYGNNHPLLSQMYHVFSDHHKSKGEVEDSINFMKSSLLNYSALFGDQNVMVANSYYKLAILLIDYNRLFEAEQYLVKAKQIMDHLRIEKSLLDGKIRLSLSSLYFKDEKYKQSLDLVSNKFDIFEDYEANQSQNYQTQRSQIYQLIYYCQIKKNYKSSNLRFCSHLQRKLAYFKIHSNFAQVLYIIIEFHLNNLAAQTKETMKKLINMIPTKMSINFYKKSYDLLRKRYTEKKLFESFKKYTENADKIVEMIIQKNLLKVWENLSKVYERQTLFDFVSLVEQLIYFLGRDRLNTI